MKHVISNCFISFINYNEELSKELDSLENEVLLENVEYLET